MGWKKEGSQYASSNARSKVQNLWLVTSYIGRERASSLVVQYDVGFLLPLLIWWYKVLMPSMFGDEVQMQSSYFHCKKFIKLQKLVQKFWLHLWHTSLMNFVATMLIWTTTSVHCLGGVERSTSFQQWFCWFDKFLGFQHLPNWNKKDFLHCYSSHFILKVSITN